MEGDDNVEQQSNIPATSFNGFRVSLNETSLATNTIFMAAIIVV